MRLVANRDIREPDLAHIEAPFFACSKVRQFLLGRSGPGRITGIPYSLPHAAAFDDRQHQQKLLQEIEEGHWFLVIDSRPGPLRPPVRRQAVDCDEGGDQWIVDESLAPAPRFSLMHAVARIEREKSRRHHAADKAPTKSSIVPIEGNAWAGMLKRYAGGNAFPQHLTAADENGIGSKIRNLYGGNGTIQNQADIEAYNNTPSFLGVTHGQIFGAMETIVTLAGLLEGGLALSRLKDAGKISEAVSSGLQKTSDVVATFSNKISRRAGIDVVDYSGGGYAADFTTNEFLREVAKNPVSLKSYEQVGAQGIDIRFVFDQVDDLAAYYPNSKIIEMYPKNIEQEARLFGYDPAEYAARVFSHEGKHARRNSLGVMTNTRYDEYLSYTREFLFQENRRPSLPERLNIWGQVKRDYPNLPDGKIPLKSLEKRKPQ